MMGALGINIRVTLEKEEVLRALRKNRAEHKAIYEEAVAGFKDHAIANLTKVLERCTGKEDVSLRLSAPQSHLPAYDTVIQALEMDSSATVGLSMGEFRMLVQDEWDWQVGFLTSNRGYSMAAVRKIDTLGEKGT